MHNFATIEFTEKLLQRSWWMCAYLTRSRLANNCNFFNQIISKLLGNLPIVCTLDIACLPSREHVDCYATVDISISVDICVLIGKLGLD